jgi:hypothetical protein
MKTNLQKRIDIPDLITGGDQRSPTLHGIPGAFNKLERHIHAAMYKAGLN